MQKLLSVSLWRKRRGGFSNSGLTFIAAVLALLLIPCLSCQRNHAPGVPVVVGPGRGHPGDVLTFRMTSIDIDGDEVAYRVSWGDSSVEAWSNSYPSGYTVTGTKSYSDSGHHEIRVQARDDRGAESDWSSVLVLEVGTFPPGMPSKPQGAATWPLGEVYSCSTATNHPLAESVSVQFDWGDSTTSEWTALAPPGAWHAAAHEFVRAGAWPIRARSKDAHGSVTDWSEALSVTVFVDSSGEPPPTPEVPAGPSLVAVGSRASYRLVTNAGAPVHFVVDWDDMTSDTTERSYAPGETALVEHEWTMPDTCNVRALAFLAAKPTRHSAWSNPLEVTATKPGVVTAFWWNNNSDQASLSTSPVLTYGSEDCIWGGCDDDYRMYGIRLEDMQTAHYGTAQFPDYTFSGHAAYCGQTGHFIVGSEEGELYALRSPDLSIAWRYPGKSVEESLTGIEWGAPAVVGDRIYIGHDSDSIFYLIDNSATPTRVAAYGVEGSVVDAPVIDAQGNVLFATESGYLYKLDPQLNFTWRVRLNPRAMHSPVLDNDGTIFCASDSGSLYAISSAGSVEWTAELGAAAGHPAVGTSGLYVGTKTGRLYELDRATGATLWSRALSTGELTSTPVLTTDGVLYVQDDDDRLYCVMTADGDTIWTCDCPSYLPGRGRGRDRSMNDYAPNPTITAEGDIIVVGHDAVYRVLGYRQSILDRASPWPKWQKNLLNTGK